MKELRFDLAGVRKDEDRVYLTSQHRTHKSPPLVAHRNDYHTIVFIRKCVFDAHFRFNYSTHIYENLTHLTWKGLKQVAHIMVFDLVNDELVEEYDRGNVIPTSCSRSRHIK